MTDMRCGNYGIYWRDLATRPWTYCPHCEGRNCQEVPEPEQEDEDDVPVRQTAGAESRVRPDPVGDRAYKAEGEDDNQPQKLPMTPVELRADLRRQFEQLREMWRAEIDRARQIRKRQREEYWRGVFKNLRLRGGS